MARDIEGPIHRSVLAYLRRALPGAVIHHSPNAIGLSGKRLAIQIGRDKSNGTVKGYPDLVVHDPRGTAFFEVKAPGNYPDKNQRELHARLRSTGHHVAVVRSIDDARHALTEWGWIDGDYLTLRNTIMPEARDCLGHDHHKEP